MTDHDLRLEDPEAWARSRCVASCRFLECTGKGSTVKWAHRCKILEAELEHPPPPPSSYCLARCYCPTPSCRRPLPVTPDTPARYGPPPYPGDPRPYPPVRTGRRARGGEA